jgi:aldehyde dehydrogenase (NAD+)
MMQQVRNPRTGETDYSFALPEAGETARICGSLRAGQSQWQRMGVDKRIAVMQEWKQAVTRHREELIASLCTDTGRHWETLLEADLVAGSIDRWCGIAGEYLRPPQQKPSSIPFLSLQQELVPYELVAVISPWNFPLLLSLIDTIPALLAGCAVIVKPSEVTPRFVEVMQQTISEVPILNDVFRYLQGDGSTGAELVQQADLVCFTGSTATGRKVYAAAAERMIPVFLEMGGKDPAIVTEGADLEAAAAAVLWGSTANAGQSCLSIERVYVQDSVFEAFVEKLARRSSAVKLAFPTMHDGLIGPVIFAQQARIIDEHLTDAVEKGAVIVTGSARCEMLGGGWYCRPTVLTGVSHDMKIMTEETFGPIMPVMPFYSKEEAIRLANGTMYGLSAAVFSADADEAMEIARELDAGAISINDAALTAVMHEGEKNAFRLSGIGGTRMGPSALKRFMRQKVMILHSGTVESPWWYKT